MQPLRKQLAQNPFFKFFSSIRITVVCLALLFVLTLWGTIAQINLGLYLAQERYFYSLFFLVFGFLPFPGARLVLWIMFMNLLCVSLVRLVYRWSHLGITTIHLGLMLFFVAAFVTFHGTKETNVTMLEAEATNVSVAYHKWELSVWAETANEEKKVEAYSTSPKIIGQDLNFADGLFLVRAKSYFPHSAAYMTPEAGAAFINASGIGSIVAKPLEKELERNNPGGIFEVFSQGKSMGKVLLYGAEDKPTKIVIGKKPFYFQLRRERFPMPFLIRLKDFRMERHPNTEIARSYESLVELMTHNTSREVLISMNNPLRYKDYTLYQASYSIDTLGRERSTLAVVKNKGRILPYIASFVTTLGLLIHLLTLAFQRGKKS